MDNDDGSGGGRGGLLILMTGFDPASRTSKASIGLL
jgi:hypothetical protein